MRTRGGIIWCSMARSPMKVAEWLRRMRSAMTSPVVTFIAAMLETVLCRTYSNSRRASRPGRAAMAGCLRDLAWKPGLLVDADQNRARGRVEVQAADVPGSQPEGGVAGAVEQAADLVRADPGLAQRPAHGGRRDRQAALAQVTGDHYARLLRSPSGGTEVATARTVSRR